MVREVTNQRKKDKIIKNDFLNSLNETFQTSNRTQDELNIVGQCVGFFVGGYETSTRVRKILKYFFTFSCIM